MSVVPTETARGLAMTAAVGLAMSGVVIAVGAAPSDPREAAGVFPPWWPPARSLDAAAQAGAVLAVGAAPFIVIVRDPGGRAPARLRAAGALLSLDAHGLAACGAKES
jgi:hypothetical protein